MNSTVKLINSDDLKAYLVHSDDEVKADSLKDAWNTAIYKCMYDAPSFENGRIGKWQHDGSQWTNRWICSECGHKIFVERSNFCPNCGAKMEGERL